MIQVLYRWKVKPGEEESFTKAWAKATHTIRTSRKGARGSVLLCSREDPLEFLATAYWDSYDDWQASRNLGHADPEAAAVMRAASIHLSTEIFEELENLVSKTS